MSDRRQLSDVGAFVMALCVGTMLVGCSIPLWAASAVFCPLILALTLFMTLGQMILYPYRGQMILQVPAGLFLGAWAVAVPLAAVLAPAADVLADQAPGPLGAVALKDRPLVSRIAVVAAVQVLCALFVSVRDYLRTPASARFEGELPRKSPALLFVGLGAAFLPLAVSFSACLAWVLVVDLLAGRREYGVRAFVAALASLTALPALIVGLACLRRGLRMREVQRLIDDHPRSTVRAAATGLVELHGVARPLGTSTPDAPVLLIQDFTVPGAQKVVGDFLLDDGTGQVRVRVPEDANPGRDGVVDLVRRSTPGGMQPEFRLNAGDPVYVLGEFVPAEGVGEIRPWRPPQGRFGASLVQELFRQDWSMWSLDYAGVLDLKLRADVFAVTDAGEERLRRMVRRRWTWSLALGFLLIGGAGAFVVRLWA